ncbi:hypothetical protein SAMD00019534_013050 [Acytostelium subglobosum LB1]|uniref:O-methyltransferase DmtA n=1 Tax=Acytostelium subglobosum TaxID=361139 RepID=A0A077JBM1_ACYSU|nr:hypothetical protein SAMD00019534_013050 [Acytostelium subglobosum LB1]BAP16679.1 O-methyltransferase DmtA [Acytostelium subglobosum]GAM18130.1 hypothetical protein SAMD00019534_013050 [Acytostelium subglobosum LB1]|eukprot:XP_012758726.1 hypothetical protein SAMD00019534_013050 [Acytostelium subglobosum LB1]
MEAKATESGTLEQREKMMAFFKVMDLADGHMRTSALTAATKLDVASAFQPGQRCTIEELAKKTNCNQQYLYRLLRALTSIGFFKEVETGVFEHTPMSEALMSSHMRDIVMMSGLRSMVEPFYDLSETVKNGKINEAKVFEGHPTYWDSLRTRPEEEAIFSRAMTSFTVTCAPQLVQMADYNQFETVCDLGGSQGILLSEILKQSPKVKVGLNFDLPSVINQNKNNQALIKTRDPRFQEVEGSFFTKVPEADCYTLKNILHDWDNKAVIEILKTVSKSMKPTSKVYVYDFLMAEKSTPENSFISWLDIKMMALLNGLERSLDDWKTVSNGCGLKVEKVIPSPMPHAPTLVIFGK